MTLQQLPTDLLKIVFIFLTGFDLLELSHSSSWMLQRLSDASLWQQRVLGVVTADQRGCGQQWKYQYFKSRSLQFHGLRTKGRRNKSDSYAYISYVNAGAVPFTFWTANSNPESFSFDVWFSLSPATDGKWFGGIVYGQQSETRESRHWPMFHQQFVVVSSTGDLYCSVLSEKPIVASNLETNRWYHLGLTYDLALQRQAVYFDGVKVLSDVGALHHECIYLTTEQVGTGCITANGGSFPRADHIGWYGFNGIIDEFRVWKGVLSHEDMTTLARGGSIRDSSGSIRNVISGAFAGSARFNANVVKCTRPAEKWLMKPRSPLEGGPQAITCSLCTII